MKLAHPVAMKRYDGLKHADDKDDAAFLAHLLRLGILPTGYIHPPQERALEIWCVNVFNWYAVGLSTFCPSRTSWRASLAGA